MFNLKILRRINSPEKLKKSFANVVCGVFQDTRITGILIKKTQNVDFRKMHHFFHKTPEFLRLHVLGILRRIHHDRKHLECIKFNCTSRADHDVADFPPLDRPTDRATQYKTKRRQLQKVPIRSSNDNPVFPLFKLRAEVLKT